MTRRGARDGSLVLWLAVLGCVAQPPAPQLEASGSNRAEPGQKETAGEGRHYLRDMVFAGRGDTFLIHWGKRKMPLSVYLPLPPPGLFEDAEGVREAVRRGVLDWTGAAGAGLPRFVFVDEMGDADIPIVWAESPDGDWYIAFCSYDVNLAQLRMGVSHILVTGRWANGEVAERDEIYKVVLHEMGHALGLGGHSSDPHDIMYPSIRSEAVGLSAADRLTLEKLYRYGPRRFTGRRSR